MDEDAAIFFMRSVVSMVLVALKVSCMIQDTLFLISRDFSPERTKEKAVSISSEMILTSPSWKSFCKALRSSAVQ